MGAPSRLPTESAPPHASPSRRVAVPWVPAPSVSAPRQGAGRRHPLVMELEEQAKAALRALPGCGGLDPEITDFMASLVAGDPKEEEATFEESLGPFLEDSGLAPAEEKVSSICEALRLSLRLKASGKVSIQEPSGGQPGAIEPPPATVMPAGGASSSIRTSPPSGSGAVVSDVDSADCMQERRSAATFEADAVSELLVRLLGAAGCDEEDLREYLAGMIIEDPGEGDATFDDTIGPMLQGSFPEMTDARIGQLCVDIRLGLDQIVEAAGGPTASTLPEIEEDTGMRRLAGGPVMLGDLDEIPMGSDVGTSGVLESHLAQKAKREEKRMQDRLNAREKEATKRRAAAEAKAAAKTAAAAARLEQQISESYAAESTVSNRARNASEFSHDIHIPQFNLPSHGGGASLLNSALLRLIHGHRYGLVGRNGTGKSTLLATLAGGRIPGVPSRLRILHVAQDSADNIVAGSRTEGVSSLEAVIQSDTRREDLLREAEEESGETLSRIYEALEAIDADGAPGRASALLRGLQFSEEMMKKPVAALSGGWRMRVSIAAALFQEPDVLLLDEPTNHLDLEAVLWLGRHLEGWEDKTLVVVSHDRSFLDEVCTDVIHLERQSLTYYPGDFSTFEAVREEKRERQRKIYEQQEAKKQEMEKFVQKHLHKGQSLVKDDAMVKQAKKVAKQIDRIGTLGQDGKKYKLSYDGPQQSAKLPEEEKGLSAFSFPNPEKVHAGAAAIQVKDVTFQYPGAPSAVFSKLNFSVGISTRCALLGRNGSGKSTLVKLITQQLGPTKGEVQRSHHLRVASFTQHHMDQLNLDQTPLEHLLEHGRISEPTITPDEVRRRIGRFGMSGHWQTQRIRTLSGGQKSRVAFCKATWSTPHILLLDEPTNHLDVETIDSLIDAVKRFEGGILCVSHDQHFLTSITEELWVVGEGPCGMRRLNASFREYKKAMLRALRARQS